MRARLRLSVTFMLAWVSPSALAGSFYLPASDSTAAMGRAFAGQSALGIDATSVMTNPAALTRLQGDGQWSVGLNALRTNVHLRDHGSSVIDGDSPPNRLPVDGSDLGNASAPAGLPNLAWAQRIDGERNLWVGIGVNAPYGLGIEYDNAFKGRYDTREARLRVLDLSGVAGLQLTDTLSIGGGINVQRTDARLEAALPFSTLVGGASSAQANDPALIVTGDSYAVGGNIGLHFKPTDTWQFGLTYRSAITHKVEGSAQVAPFPSTAMDVKLHLPASVAASVAWKATEDLTLLAEAKWVNWSRLKNLTFQFANELFPESGTTSVKPDDYRDAYSLALGADYRLNADWTVRAGYQLEQTPTINANRSTDVPDANRHWFAVGTSWTFQPGWGLDMSYARLQFENVTIDRTDALGTNTKVAGRPSANFFGAAVRRAF